ncbi:MAG: type IV secretory system conjugative DNA transfer family protein [Lachnospiraceae bacterium]|nr:type IV secretory system conjugative DNA transfer family protein [Lachnospiraceae bacterium]
MPSFDKLVLSKHMVVSTNSKETGRNNNVLVVGTSGSGKTYSLVEPTLMEARSSSLVVSDPKGTLSRKYGKYFKSKGYTVEALDFLHLEESTITYDPLRNGEITNSQEALSFAHTLVSSAITDAQVVSKDPFWDQMAEVLIASVVLLMLEVKCLHPGNFATLVKLLDSLDVPDATADSLARTALGRCMEKHSDNMPSSEAYRLYRSVVSNPSKTLNCIISSVHSVMARYNTESMRTFTQLENLFKPEMLMQQKTVLFVKCSDVDDTLYGYINMFYTQTMSRLFQYSDGARSRSRLRPVRFILDDFATNVVIPQMPKWSSMMRERQISVMLMIQSITQLEEMYDTGKARTIISNCDYLAFLRTNDLVTAKEFAERLDIPATDVLYMPIGTMYVFQSGARPMKDERFDMKTQSRDYRKVYPAKAKLVEEEEPQSGEKLA